MPFIAFTAITACYKGLIQHFVPVQVIKYPLSMGAFEAHLLNPSGGFATYLWFIYALMVIQLAYPLLKRICPYDGVLFVGFAALNLLPLPSSLCLDHAIRNMPFFLMGILTTTTVMPVLSTPRIKWLALCGCVAVYCVSASYLKDFFLIYIVLGATMNASVALLVPYLPGKGLWAYLGDRSIDVYLWHTLGIGVCAFLLARLEVSQFWISTLACFLIVISACTLGADIINRIPGLRLYLYGRR